MPSRKVKFNDLLVKIVADDRLTKVMKRTQKLIKGTAKLSAKASAAVTAIGTGAFAVAIAKSTEFGASIARTTSQLGLGTAKFQEYFNAAKFTDAKLDVVDFGDALKDVVERITEANTLGKGDLFDSAQAIGLNSDLRESGEIVDDLIFKMGQLSKEDRLFRTRELVGDSSFEQLSGLLSLSTERLQELISESKKLGLIISPENLSNLSQAMRSMGVLRQLVTTLGAEIAADLAPRLVRLTVWITEFVKANGGIGQLLDKVFTNVNLKVMQLKGTLDGLPGIDLNLSDTELELKKYNSALGETESKTRKLAVVRGEIAKLEANAKRGFFFADPISLKLRRSQAEKLTEELQKAKQLTENIRKPEILNQAELSLPELSADDIEDQVQKLLGNFDKGKTVKVPVVAEPDVNIDTAKVEKNIEPLKKYLSDTMIDVAIGATESLSPAFGPAIRSLLEAGLDNVGSATGADLANEFSDGFHGAIGQLMTDKSKINKILSAEELCKKAEENGEKAASCLSRAFVTKMEGLESVLGTAGNLLGGFESLMAANESREMERIARAKTRNTAELDILKSRLSNAKTVTQAEIALYNRQVAGVNARNKSLDIAAAAAEAKACKRAKKFAVLQGAIAVAAAWAAAAKAGSFAAGAGPIAFFTGFGSVLSAGLGAAAQIAKFDCNKIGSTSGGAGGGGGGGLGSGGGLGVPQQTQRAGADLSPFDASRRQKQSVFNFNLQIDPITSEIIVEKINDGDAQINVRNVEGVF